MFICMLIYISSACVTKFASHQRMSPKALNRQKNLNICISTQEVKAERTVGLVLVQDLSLVREETGLSSGQFAPQCGMWNCQEKCLLGLISGCLTF
jgi:hypothetical protein